MMMMGWTEEKEREGRSGADRWGDWGMSMDIEKEKKKKKKRWERERKRKEKCLEQPHARTMIV